MSVEKELLALGEKIIEKAPELVPIAVKALAGMFEGKNVEDVLTRAEREIIGARSQKGFDEALAGAHGKRPNTGG